MDLKAILISIGQKLFAFVEITRVSVIFMGIPFALAGAAYALSITLIPVSLLQAIMGVLSVFLVTGAVHTIDDYFDRKRDRSLWPNRQISSRGITPRTALIISLFCYGVGFALVFGFFNVLCGIVLLIAAIWATTYTGFLRERYGYMTLPFAIGLFPIGGYVAFAPQTLWTNPIPWILYLMVFLWQSTHILAYSPPHGLQNGKTAVPFLIKRFSPEITLITAGIFAGFCMSVGIVVFFLTNLSYLFLGVTVGLGILLICMSVYTAKNLTTKHCMTLVFANSAYGWVVFLLMTLEYLARYDMLFFYIVLGLGIFMMASTPLFGGFGMPNIELGSKK